MSRKTKNRKRRSSRTRKLGRRRMKGGFWPFTSEESNYTYQPQQSWEEWASSLGKKTKEGATSFWDKTKSTFSSSDSYSSSYVPSTSTYVPSTSTYEPSTSTYEPSTSTYVPSTSTYVPSTSTYVPSSSTYVPSSSTSVPSSSTYVPSSSTSVPSTYESSTTPIQPAVTGGKVKRRRKKNRTKRG
jgi:hypothetical protein